MQSSVATSDFCFDLPLGFSRRSVSSVAKARPSFSEGSPGPSPSWHYEIAAQINGYLDKEAGWKGVGSVPLTESIAADANLLIRSLHAASVSIQLVVGLDYEGTLTFSYHDEGLSLILTIEGDHTLTAFAQRGARCFSQDSLPLDLPLPDKLLDLMRVE